jgi:hypothetical protein
MIIDNYTNTLPENKEEFFSNQFSRVCPKIFLKRYKERINYTDNLVLPYYVTDNDDRRSWKKSGNTYEIDHFTEDYNKTFTVTVILDPDSENPTEFKQTTFWGDQVIEINPEFSIEDVGPHCFGIKCTQNDGTSSIMHFAKFMVDDPEEEVYEVNLNNVSEYSSSFTTDITDSLKITPFIGSSLDLYAADVIEADPLAALLHEHPLNKNYPAFCPRNVALVDESGNPIEFRVAVNKSKRIEYGARKSIKNSAVNLEFAGMKVIIADYNVTVNKVNNEVESITIEVPESDNDKNPNGFHQVPPTDSDINSYEYNKTFATNYPKWSCQSEKGYIYITDINYFTGNTSSTIGSTSTPTNKGGQTKEKISGTFELTTVWEDELGVKHKLEDYIASSSRDIPDGARLAAAKNKVALTRLCESVVAAANEGQKCRLILPKDWKIIIDYHKYNSSTDTYVPGAMNIDREIYSGGSYISLPNNFTLDLNGTEIWALPSHDIGKASILGMNHNFDTHIINGSILGSYRYRKYLEQERGGGCSLAEGVGNTFIRSSEFCTYENVDIAYSLSYDADMGHGGCLLPSARLGSLGKSVCSFDTTGYIDEQGNIVNLQEFSELPEIINKKLILPRVSTGEPGKGSVMDGDVLSFPLRGVTDQDSPASYARSSDQFVSLNNSDFNYTSIFIYKKSSGVEYNLVTNESELGENNKIILVSGKGRNTGTENVRVMGKELVNNTRTAVILQATSGSITPTEDCCIITLKKSGNYWKLLLENDEYLTNNLSTTSGGENCVISINPLTCISRVIFGTANDSGAQRIRFHLNDQSGDFRVNSGRAVGFFLFKKQGNNFVPITSTEELQEGLEIIISDSVTTNKYARILYQEDDRLVYNSNRNTAFNTRGAVINNNLELKPLGKYQTLILHRSNEKWKLELKDVFIGSNKAYLSSSYNKAPILAGNTTGTEYDISIDPISLTAKIISNKYEIKYNRADYAISQWGRGDAVLEWGKFVEYGNRKSFISNNDYFCGNIFFLNNAYRTPGLYHNPYKRESFVHFYNFNTENNTNLSGISKYMKYLGSCKVISGYPFIPPKGANFSHITSTGTRDKIGRNYLDEGKMARTAMYCASGSWSSGYKNCTFHDERSSLFDNNYANQCFAENCYMWNLGAERSSNDAGWSNQTFFVDIEDNSFYNKDFYVTNCENIFGNRGFKVHFSFNLNVIDCKNMNPYLLKGVNGLMVEGHAGRLTEEMSISNPINYHVIRNSTLALKNNNYGAFGDGKKDIGLQYNTVHQVEAYSSGVHCKDCYKIID